MQGCDIVDFKFFGIIDIVLVLIMIISLILGYKKGFVKKAIGLVGLLVALVVAAVFCCKLSEFLQENKVFYSIYSNVENNIIDAIIENDMVSDTKNALMQVGVPDFLASFFADKITGSVNPFELASNVAAFFYDIVMNVISFIILFVGVFLVTIVLKIIANILRANAIIKFVDGILGMVLYFCSAMIVVYVIFAIVGLLYNQSFFITVKEFLDVDMKLNEDTFRLSKFFYSNNIITNFFKMFLPK